MKFAVINVIMVFEESQRGKEMAQRLQQVNRTWQTKWQGVEEQRKKLVNQIQAAEARQAAADSMNLQRALQGVDMELSYLRQRGEAELKAQVQASQETIMQELAPVLATYAKRNSITAVFTLPAMPALYVDPSMDVTKEVVAFFDSQQKPASASRPGVPPLSL